jgi:hypothetical protein
MAVMQTLLEKAYTRRNTQTNSQSLGSGIAISSACSSTATAA